MTFAWLGSVGGGIADAVRWLEGALDWLGDLLDPVGEILTRVWPPVLAAIAAIALLRTVRWLLLLWRGRTPRVQISNFAWAMSDDASREATWVTSLFREQLAALRLDALDPLPERAPGAPLVEIVEGVGQGVGRDIAGAAGRVFKAIWPDSAYEVWGTLRPREGGGGRISVQLIERRRGNRTLLNVALEETSWENGAREAAMAVAGALYPQVRQSDRGPWTNWPRIVPLKLMGHYHAARRYEEGNRLEHALAEYHAALDQDPLNPNLRLKIAMLQERLELYLDAWVTYEAIVDESNPKAWRGRDRRVYLLALYRLAVMLSNGRVAAQWVKGASLGEDEGTKRDQERHQRRGELMRSLEHHPLFESHRFHLSQSEVPERFTGTVSYVIANFRSSFVFSVLRTIDTEARGPSDALDAFSLGGEYEERERRIEAVLQVLGLHRLEQLERAMGRGLGWRLLWWWRRSPEFPRSAVRTSKLLVRMRIAASLESQVERSSAGSQSFRNRDQWIEEIREAHTNLTKRWPFATVSRWRKLAQWLAPRRRWTNRREDAWQLHYNAACTAASILRSDSVLRNFKREMSSLEDPSEETEDKLRALPKGIDEQSVVRQAISQLEEYAFRAGSDRVAAQADWVAIDDPDLQGLRESSEFKLWASHHLPRALPEGLSSRKADVKRFTVRVVHEGARVFADSWLDRAGQSKPSATQIVDWWRVEAEVWAALANACREHLSWQERLNWLQTLQKRLRAAEKEDEVDFSHEARGAAAADSMSQGLFDELATLASANGQPEAEGVLGWVDERARHVRGALETGEARADARGHLRAKAERQEALRAARIWTRLAEALEAELSGSCEEDSDEELQERMRLIRDQLSSTPGPRKPLDTAIRRLAWLRSAARRRWNGRAGSQAPR